MAQPNSSGKAAPAALRFANLIGRALEAVSLIIALASLVAMFLALVADVIVRYMTTRGLGWPTEVPNLLFPWLIMGGIVLVAHRGAHIAATALIDMLPIPKARVLALATQVLLVGTFASLAVVSIKVIGVTVQQVFPLTRIPQFWAYAAVTFGCGGIAIAAAVNFVRIFYAADPRKLIEQPSAEHQI